MASKRKSAHRRMSDKEYNERFDASIEDIQKCLRTITDLAEKAEGWQDSEALGDFAHDMRSDLDRLDKMISALYRLEGEGSVG